MGLRDQIIPYIQGDGLVAPAIVTPPGTFRTSDNGVMFTSEYYIMLNRNGLLQQGDVQNYQNLIGSCISGGQLHRGPGDTTEDTIDDHLGVLAGYAEFNLSANFTLPLDLWRFPQLVYAWALAKGVPSLVMLPLAIINAFIIGFSSMSDTYGDADARRLNWDLYQATKRKSWLASLAGSFWHGRQVVIYGPNVMRAVAATYYQTGHPFIQYWVD